MLREMKAEGELGLFEALANTLPALVRICDAQGASIWFNKEWLDFRGRTSEDERGAGWLEGLYPADVETSLDVLSHRFARRQPYEIKYRLRHHSGQYRWVLHKAAPRFDATGEFLGFITACVDIHDAILADLERSRFFDVASDILLVSNRAGYIDKVNSSCERVLGWNADEMTRMPLVDLVHPDDLSATLATADILSRGEELIDFENRFRHKDGGYRWLSWRAKRDTEQGVVYGSAVDITQRKAFETDLQQSIDRYNLAISATSDGIWDWDVHTDALYLSPRNIEMLGFSAQRPPPKTSAEWRTYVNPEDIATATAAYDAYIRGEADDYRTVFRVKHGDGSWRTLLSRGVALRGEDDVPYRVIGVHADITEQKDLEDRLRLLKDQAEAANQAKTDFLANMSHEIRTPMNAVIGAAQLLGMGAPLTDKQQKLVGILKDSSKALMELINDFLDLSKIESGNLELEQVEFDARNLVAEVLQLLEVQAQTKGLTLLQTNDCACINERLFVGDPARIRQLLLNLCSNAVKFTDQGAVSVDIRCQPGSQSGFEDLFFSIKDTGMGIPADKIQSIFGKFEQGDTSVTRKFGGTGLGLAIVKALVEAMNGSIDVASEVGQGATFTVRLPLRRGHQSQPSSSDHITPIYPAADSPRILIVEDIPANVQIVQHFLDEFGFRSDVASDGRHALERISSGLTYDAVLMDIQMPGMDGREATRLIRRYEHDHHQVPHQIIAITAHAMATDREKCFAAGMNDYLSKPFDPKVLEQKLVRAIAARRKAETQSSMSVVEDQNSPPDDFRSADGGGDV